MQTKNFELYKTAHDLAQQGKSIAEIAREMGVSYTWAKTLVMRAQRMDMSNGMPWHEGLPTVAVNALQRAGITSLDALKGAYNRNELAQVSGLGAKGMNAISDFLANGAPDIASEIDRQRSYSDGVAIRKAVRLLEKHGYKITPP